MSLRAGGSTVAKFLGGLFSLNGTQFPVVLRSERTDIGALLVVVHVFGRYGAYKACAVVAFGWTSASAGALKTPTEASNIAATASIVSLFLNTSLLLP
jgi:hypothetical protein